jgi:hypothetical protein
MTPDAPPPPAGPPVLIPPPDIVRARLVLLHREARFLRRLLRLSRDAAASPNPAAGVGVTDER